jgi:5-methylcytosine-specific restriction protein A
MPIAPRPACTVSTCPERAPCPVHGDALERVDDKRWYHLARWRHPVWGLRAVTLRRHPICVACKQAGRVVASTEVDHVVPHRGDPALFWSPTNLQGLCNPCHGAKTKRGE